MGNCLGGGEPPVVYTVCPSDGKAHDFGDTKVADRDPSQKGVPQTFHPCPRCGKTKEQVLQEAQNCKNGNHQWISEVVPMPQPNQPMPQPGTAIPVGTPVQTVLKCTVCGMRRSGQDGNYVYDDYYMYGGGYMLGTDMMMFGMLYGASDMAYYDHQSYGGDYGMDQGFDADGGFGMDDGDDFDFD